MTSPKFKFANAELAGIGCHFHKERDEKDSLVKNQHVSANWPIREISQVISLYLSLKERRAKHNGGQ